MRGKAEAEDGALVSAGAVSRLLKIAEGWRRPEFPVTGRDLKKRGLLPGPDLGRELTKLEDLWVDSDFKPGREELLAKL